MSVYTSILNIKGSDFPKDNPLPFYQHYPRHREVAIDDNYKEDDNSLLGYETAPRYLPYKKQDFFTRDRNDLSLKTIVMENEYLVATFLPEYGGRLYSLYNKEMGRELLYKNPVIQPANLAILNAWISGGIEWNVGQYGHSFTTSSPIFCAVLKDQGGEDFLRIYEYERTHNLFWHLDFHLPKESKTLNLYARIINDQDASTSMYYWTNIAVQEEEQTRLFSGADEVIYLNTETSGFGKADMPYLPSNPELDSSYPMNFPFSNEYFFNTSASEKAPWEAAVYPDDWVFFERSSDLLRYRKMFCWGTHQGGNSWKDYLSDPGQGDYLEIQGGFAQTQLHGMIVEGHEVLDFVQSFGGASLDTEPYYVDDWNVAKATLEEQIEQWMPEDGVHDLLDELRQYASQEPDEIISYGSGFGALEVYRRQVHGELPVPSGLSFPKDSMGEEQEAWIKLLDEGFYPELDNTSIPSSFMTSPIWENLLRESLEIEKGWNWATYAQLSVILMDQGKYDEAREMVELSIEASSNPLAYRNLAILEDDESGIGKSIDHYESALELAEGRAYLAILIEYFELLLREGEYQRLWDKYETLSYEYRDYERILLYTAKAAIELDKLEFVPQVFDREYASIRENETILSDIWLEYHRKLEISKQGIENITLREVEKLHPVPARLDLRTGVDIEK